MDDAEGRPTDLKDQQTDICFDTCNRIFKCLSKGWDIKVAEISGSQYILQALNGTFDIQTGFGSSRAVNVLGSEGIQRGLTADLYQL